MCSRELRSHDKEGRRGMKKDPDTLSSAAVVGFNLRSPEVETSTPHPQPTCLSSFYCITESMSLLNCRNAKCFCEFTCSTNSSKHSISVELFNHHTTLWSTYYYHFHFTDEKTGHRAVGSFIESYWVVEYRYEPLQYGDQTLAHCFIYGYLK